jgi:integrase
MEDTVRRTKGQGSLIKVSNSPFFHARFYDGNGRKICITTGTKVKQEAEAFLRKQMSAVRDNRQSPLTDVKKIKYADLRAGLLASYTERGNKSLLTRADGEESVMGLPQLDSFFRYSDTNPGPSVLQIGTETARTFVKQRQSEGVGNAVINRSLACLRRMLRIAHEESKISVMPKINLLKEPPARKGFVEFSQFNRLIGMLPTHLRSYVTFLYYCGGRSGEAKQIEWSQVDLKRRLIRLEDEQTKTGLGRVVPLPSVLFTMLSEVQGCTGLVFNVTNIRKEWNKACAHCKLGVFTEVEGKPYDPRYQGLTLHDLRRSAARNLLNAGVPETVIMKIGGWKTRSVFDRYAVASTADLTAAMTVWETASLEMGKDKVNSVPVLTGEITNNQ